MKRVLALIFAVCMATIGLAGCESEEERAEKRKQQEYDNAQSLMEAGNYSEARDAFIMLGDYQDSVEQSIRCGQRLFCVYLKGNGPLLDEIGSSDMKITNSVSLSENGNVLLTSTTKSERMWCSITAELPDGLGTAAITGEYTYTHEDGKVWTESGRGQWDIKGYNTMKSVPWDDFTASYTRSLYPYNLKDNGVTFYTMVSYLAKILNDSGVDVTMAELGFTNWRLGN